MSWSPNGLGSSTLINRAAVALAVLVLVTSARAQMHGTISGTINPSAADVTVVATNQVSSQVTRSRVAADGRYSLKLRPGAYAISVEPPYIAKFAQGKNYGEHALIREDSLENVIVSDGKETTIDFAVERRAEQPAVNISERKPLGAAGQESSASEPQ